MHVFMYFIYDFVTCITQVFETWTKHNSFAAKLLFFFRQQFIDDRWNNSVQNAAPTKNRKSTTVVGLNTITCPYLLYTALKATLHVGQSGYFVEVAMSSDEEIERQSELSEGALGRAQYDWLVVDLQSPTSTLPRETNCVPRIQRHLPNASVLTDIRTRSHHSSTSFSSSSLSSIHQHQ